MLKSCHDNDCKVKSTDEKSCFFGIFTYSTMKRFEIYVTIVYFMLERMFYITFRLLLEVSSVQKKETSCNQFAEFTFNSLILLALQGFILRLRQTFMQRLSFRLSVLYPRSRRHQF